MFRRGISGETLGHAIPGRLAVAGRCAAGVRSSLLEDALAASTSFAGLRQRRAARRRTTYPESTSLGIWPKRSAGILWDSQGLVQVRVVEDVPEPTYYLMIRQRLICHHKLDLSQREYRKHVAAALQGRSYGGRLDEFSYSRNRRSVRQIVRGP